MRLMAWFSKQRHRGMRTFEVGEIILFNYGAEINIWWLLKKVWILGVIHLAWINHGLNQIFVDVKNGVLVYLGLSDLNGLVSLQ